MKGSEVKVVIEIKKLYDFVTIPSVAKQGDAGVDLRACVSPELTDDEINIVIAPKTRALVKTGLAMALPLGVQAEIRPRSGLAIKHGITVLNSPGTIDSGYRGEIGVVLYNAGDEPFVVNDGDRIAQMVIMPYALPSFDWVEDLDKTDRGTSGFGSTGTK